MKKQGFIKGQGLGKSNQGVTEALQVKTFITNERVSFRLNERTKPQKRRKIKNKHDLISFYKESYHEWIPAKNDDKVSLKRNLNMVIPFDAANPEFRFKPQPLPDDFDFSKYIPVYTSSVSHPGHLYIQIQGKKTVDALLKLTENIESVYNGKKSSRYIMQNSHIKEGASCVALWPTDGHWYRAVITSVPNMETVKVYYVDYGTRDTISKHSLRYMKKEFTDLPAQALRCRLAFLKPANHATWNAASCKRILSLCEDVSLMAKIVDVGADGIYSIILCDANAEKDVYINDVLCNEGFADCVSTESPVPSQPEPVRYSHNLNLLLALVSVRRPKPELGRPNVDMSSAATLVPPGFSSVPTNATAYKWL